MAEIATILTNWKRPQNLPRICKAVRQQSHPSALYIVDNSPDGILPPMATELADDVWRVGVNGGPPIRFAPAFKLWQYDYFLFLDDDLIPGEKCIENCLDHCRDIPILGEIGRRFVVENGAWRYRRVNVAQSPSLPVPVDMTARAHFVRADCIHHACELGHAMWSRYGSEVERELFVNDDILLCLSVAMRTDRVPHLMPYCEPQRRLRMKDMDAPHAINASAGFLEQRDRFINRFAEMGWRQKWN